MAQKRRRDNPAWVLLALLCLLSALLGIALVVELAFAFGPGGRGSLASLLLADYSPDPEGGVAPLEPDILEDLEVPIPTLPPSTRPPTPTPTPRPTRPTATATPPPSPTPTPTA
ncbi:MAG: hypothetical protein ACPL7G_03495, partial [Chloroflexia bacterium]